MNDTGERNMLVRFSVSTMGGFEIFSYDVEKFKEVATDLHLMKNNKRDDVDDYFCQCP